MKMPATTMREVAARARVSTSTVSLALRNSPLVAASTRDLIRTLAVETGYRVNPLVAAHMRTRRKPASRVTGPVLAIVDTQRRRHGWRDNRTSMVRQMLAGARAQASLRGYATREFWLHEPGLSHARFSTMLRARGISGVLLGPSSDLDLELDLAWDWFSVVRLGSARVEPPLHRIVTDHFEVGMRAAQNVYDLGFRRPLFPVRELFSKAHDRRMEGGFVTTWSHLPRVRRAALPSTPGLPTQGDLERWLREYRPDVVIDYEERHLSGLLAAGGWRVPDDVNVLSLCATEWGGAVSGCVQNGDAMGRAGIDLLVALIERNETGLPALPVTLSTGSVWNPGRTLGPARA